MPPLSSLDPLDPGQRAKVALRAVAKGYFPNNARRPRRLESTIGIVQRSRALLPATSVQVADSASPRHYGRTCSQQTSAAAEVPFKEAEVILIM